MACSVGSLSNIFSFSWYPEVVGSSYIDGLSDGSSFLYDTLKYVLSSEEENVVIVTFKSIAVALANSL